MRSSQLVISRIAWMIPMLFLVSVIAFLLIEMVPGDPARNSLGPDASDEAVEALREQWHLNEPLPVRYGIWALGAIQGDFGVSMSTREPVLETIFHRLPVTLSLALAAMVIAVTLGVVGGMLAGARIGSKVDRALNSLAGLVLSVPDFWVGLLIIALILQTKILPIPLQGYVPFERSPSEWLVHLILPGVTLALHPAAEIFRQTRASVSDVTGLDFVRTLKASGVSRSHTLFAHIGKNSMVAVLAVLGLQLGLLLGHTAIVEMMFGMNGIGSLVAEAALNADVVTIQGCVVVIAVFVLTMNLVIDVLYLYLNPRLRAK